MQIRELVLYGYNGKVRHLPFALGKVNIITGRSKSGKSAIGDIKPERPVPLKQLGSGSNWVGVHLIAYFALQHYFIGAKRPVPRFMFLDQPSQVYFPSEFDEKKTDWNEVNKIYQFVIDRTTELQGQLQVIIVDHADLKKDSFREFIRENWWPDDKNLVPIDWYKSE